MKLKGTKDFENVSDDISFNAQVVRIAKENLGSDGMVERYVISLGHFIYTHHYTYYPYNNNWHETIINQEFFEDVVQPFQQDRSRK